MQKSKCKMQNCGTPSAGYFDGAVCLSLAAQGCQHLVGLVEGFFIL